MPHLELTYPRPDIAVVTLNRPEKLNALNYDLVEELHATLDDIDADDECRVVVLTGAGRGFCSGLDLTDPNPPRRGRAASSSRGRACGGRSASPTSPRAIHRLRQPVIAAVNGPAYGGGFGIALACDIRIASTSARFCTQFIKLGLGGCDIGVSYTLPRIVGAGPGVRPDPDRARGRRRRGAATRPRLPSVGGLGCVDDALAIAETLCGYGKFGVESTKQVLWANLEASSLEAALHVENRSQILASTGGEVAPRSARRSATVDDDDRARHVAARIRTQQQCGADHLVGRGQPSSSACRRPCASTALLRVLRIMSVSTGPGAMALTRMP